MKKYSKAIVTAITWAAATGWVMWQQGDPVTIEAAQMSLAGFANTALVWWAKNKGVT